jgi:septum formation protein
MKFNLEKPVILASGSPRRKELLSLLDVPFSVITSDVNEDFEKGDKNLEDYSILLATHKALAVAKKHPDHVVIGADTLVGQGLDVFPKPKNAEEAKAFLTELSGKSHQVTTGVTIVVGGETFSFASSTTVTFKALDEGLIDVYVATGDSLDKAGAYGIQTMGALLVEKIEGDYYAVMGLPIAELTNQLRKLGILSIMGGDPSNDH